MLRAVIFDFDGVIADDERLHLAGFRHALASSGITISEADYYARYLGRDDRDGFRAMLRDAGYSTEGSELQRLIARKHERFCELARERVRIYPGVRSLLRQLRSGQRPVATGIGSGALRSEIDLVLGVCGLTGEFDAIVSADDVAHGKPNPETYRLACERLGRCCSGLQPDECLVIEDSAAGLAAGAAAGMRTVAVTNSRPRDSLDADLVVDTLRELDRTRCESLWDN